MRRFKPLIPWLPILAVLGVVTWHYRSQWAWWAPFLSFIAFIALGFWYALKRELSHRGEEGHPLQGDDSMPQTVVRLLVGLAVLAALVPFTLVILKTVVGLSGISRLWAEGIAVLSFAGLVVLMAAVAGSWYVYRAVYRARERNRSAFSVFREAGTGNRHSHKIVVSIVASVIVVSAVVALTLRPTTVEVPEYPSLAENPDPAIPGRIAFSRHGDAFCIWTVAGSGGEPQEALCEDYVSFGSTLPAWTPDGLLVTRSNGLGVRTHDPDTGEIVERFSFDDYFTVSPRERDPHTSPNGRMVYTDNDGEVARLIIEDSNGTWRTIMESEPPSAWWKYGAMWSPDGEWVLVDDGGNRIIIVAAEADPNPRILVEDIHNWDDVHWFIPGFEEGTWDPRDGGMATFSDFGITFKHPASSTINVAGSATTQPSERSGVINATAPTEWFSVNWMPADDPPNLPEDFGSVFDHLQRIGVAVEPLDRVETQWRGQPFHYQEFYATDPRVSDEPELMVVAMTVDQDCGRFLRFMLRDMELTAGNIIDSLYRYLDTFECRR